MIGEERIGRIHAALPMRSLEELRDCIDARVRRAIAKEREACAERLKTVVCPQCGHGEMHPHCVQLLAAAETAIRARGERV